MRAWGEELGMMRLTVTSFCLGEMERAGWTLASPLSRFSVVGSGHLALQKQKRGCVLRTAPITQVLNIWNKGLALGRDVTKTMSYPVNGSAVHNSRISPGVFKKCNFLYLVL